MHMTPSPLNSSRPIWGILSVTLAILALFIVVYFALFGGIPHSLQFIQIALVLLLVLLVFGLITGLIGVSRNELPRWLSMSGLILTIVIIVAAVLLLNWLIG
jgi:hypothetical protein